MKVAKGRQKQWAWNQEALLQGFEAVGGGTVLGWRPGQGQLVQTRSICCLGRQEERLSSNADRLIGLELRRPGLSYLTSILIEKKECSLYERCGGWEWSVVCGCGDWEAVLGKWSVAVSDGLGLSPHWAARGGPGWGACDKGCQP